MEEKENFVEQFGKAKSGHKRIGKKQMSDESIVYMIGVDGRFS